MRTSSRSTASPPPRTPGTRRFPGSAASALRNLVTVIPGATPDAILVLAHRDDTGVGPGANDNASGTAALIELARGYGRLGTVAGRPKPKHTLVFLSSDGGAYGGFGAERFAATSRYRGPIKAVVVARRARRARRSRGSSSRASRRARPRPRSLRTADVRVAAQLGRPPARPGWLVQLVDLGMPFGYGEQAPFLGRGISAVRLATAPDDDADAAADTPGAARTGAVRRARPCRRGDPRVARRRHRAGRRHGRRTSTSGNRIVRGWAIELVLLAALDPVSRRRGRLFARCRRRSGCRCPALGGRCGAGSASGSGSGSSSGSARSPACSRAARRSRRRPDSPAVHRLAGRRARRARPARRRSAGCARAGRSCRRRPPSDEERLAGYAVALARPRRRRRSRPRSSAPTGSSSSLPSLYAWLWLPQVRAALGLGARRALRRRPRRARARRSSRSAPSSGSGSTPRSTSSR